MSTHKEIAFEDEICEHLGSHGWIYVEGDLACFGNPDPVGMKVNYPLREETFDDDETTEEASS
jgi:hypothetical protein